MIVVFLFIIKIVAANNIYQYDSLELQLGVKGEFELVPKEDSSSLKEIKAQLLLFPKNDFIF